MVRYIYIYSCLNSISIFEFSDLKPKVALQMLPALPSYILFMMVRYTDHLNNDLMVRSLIQGAIATIKRAVKKKGANDIDVRPLQGF